MEVLTYTCRNCGAALSHSIDTQSWDCKFCGSSYALDEIQGAGKPEIQEPQASGFHNFNENEASAYECPSCGGHIVTDKNTAATFCVYCHNPTVIASRLRDRGMPDLIIPFKLGKDEAVKALQKLCKGKPLLPKEFRESAVNGEVSGLYVPFWLFDSDVDGYMEGLGRRVTVWSDRKYHYTKTDTYKVVRSGSIFVKRVPVDGSAKLDDKLMEAMEPYHYGELRDFAMEYVSGHFAETYEIPSGRAGERAASRMKDGMSGILREQVRGYNSFDVKQMDVKTRNFSHKYAMLPVWTLMHMFGGKTYYFVMNGQTGTIVGKLPISWRKAGVIFGVVSALSFLAMLIGGLT